MRWTKWRKYVVNNTDHIMQYTPTALSSWHTTCFLFSTLTEERNTNFKITMMIIIVTIIMTIMIMMIITIIAASTMSACNLWTHGLTQLYLTVNYSFRWRCRKLIYRSMYDFLWVHFLLFQSAISTHTHKKKETLSSQTISAFDIFNQGPSVRSD